MKPLCTGSTSAPTPRHSFSARVVLPSFVIILALSFVLRQFQELKAVQYALKKRGIEFMVVSRNEERGDITYDNLTSDIIAEHKLIINTTPVGMFPEVESAPAIDYSAIGAEHRLFDLVYNPAKTQFLTRGEERGAKTMGGMLMLQTQAIASWHLWNEKPADEACNGPVA